MNDIFLERKDDITKVALDLAERGFSQEDIIASVLEMASDALVNVGIPELMVNLTQVKPVSLSQYYIKVSEGKLYHSGLATEILQIHEVLSWLAFTSIYVESRNRLLGHRPSVTDANFSYKRVRSALGFKNAPNQFNI